VLGLENLSPSSPLAVRWVSELLLTIAQSLQTQFSVDNVAQFPIGTSFNTLIRSCRVVIVDLGREIYDQIAHDAIT
jgi:hypothetical protein